MSSLCPQVGILERSTFNFTVNNQAKFSSEVNFEVTGPVLKYLEVNPKVENHVVKVGGQLLSSLSFCPRGTCTLKDVHLSIKVGVQSKLKPSDYKYYCSSIVVVLG